MDNTLAVSRILAFVLLLLCCRGASAQTLTTLVNFNGNNGSTPEYGALVQGTDGNFYGTTYTGGVNGCGTVFKITPSGNLTTIYTFPAEYICYSGPNASLVQASDGNLYGTTLNNGTQNYGTIFKVSTAGAFTTLFNFDYTHGNIPNAGLIQGADGNLYGTTVSGGTLGEGTVIRVTLAGQVATVHNFATEEQPFYDVPEAGLIQGSDGNFYGTTSGGGSDGAGTVFKITPGGVVTLLHSFNISVDGRVPNAPLVQASDGNFYGTTTAGGTGTPLGVYGTVFKISPSGAFTLLHTFTGTGNDGNEPNYAALVQGADGNLYGTTARGGTSNNGTIFKVTLAGAVSTVYSFSVTDGATPLGGMVLGNDGNLYGTTSAGGSGFAGTIFRYSTGGSQFSLSAVGIYRSSNGLWLENSQFNNMFTAADTVTLFAGSGLTPQAGDIPVVGDWSGNGITKIGLYRPATGTWFLDYNGNGVFDGSTIDRQYQYGGVAGDIPVVGDWSGTGTSKIGIFRGGFFWLLDANGNGIFDSGDQTFAFGGLPGCIGPLPGFYNSEPAGSCDIPVVGDWNQTGTTKVGVVRAAPGSSQPFLWILDTTGTRVFGSASTVFAFGGIAGDMPLVGDWNGSGKAQIGVFRAAFLWVEDTTAEMPAPPVATDTLVAFPYGGVSGDQPVVGHW